MAAKILLVLAFYLFAAVWVFCQTEDEMREMREAVYINADQWRSAVEYTDAGRGER